ncbi:MAG: DUF59 domain-containing protein [Desulfobacterales bacterium]|nr:DUF59 domain-containing protein [Desulfobacterales bacterium]
MLAEREFEQQLRDSRQASPRVAPASRTVQKAGAPPPVQTAPAPISREEIIAALKKLKDPELGINVVDLGLIQKVDIGPDAIVVHMLLTKIFCPYQNHIVANIKTLVGAEAARPVKVVIDYEKRWNSSFMTPEGVKRWRAFLQGETEP